MDMRKKQTRQYFLRLSGCFLLGIVFLIVVFLNKPATPGFIFGVIGAFSALIFVTFYAILLVGIYKKE